MDKIRSTLTQTAAEGPTSGPDYIEGRNRIRRWMLDLADTMLPIYVSLVHPQMTVNAESVERVLAYARAEFELDYDQYEDDMDAFRREVDAFEAGVRETLYYEEVSDYSSTFAGSRAALQAIQTAVSAPDDFDILSVALRAAHLAEQCALAHAYQQLSNRLDGLEPSTREVAQALASARKDLGGPYLRSLHARFYDNISTFEHGAELETSSPSL